MPQGIVDCYIVWMYICAQYKEGPLGQNVYIFDKQYLCYFYKASEVSLHKYCTQQKLSKCVYI